MATGNGNGNGNGNEISDDEVSAAMAEIYERHREALYEMIYEYVDDEDLDDGMLSHLLVDLATTARLNAFIADNDDPNVEDLKAELDDYGDDLAGVVREAKNDAAGFISALKDERSE